MAYNDLIRQESLLATGLSIEGTEGTSATLTSANFVGDWKAGLIVPKYTTNKLEVGGNIGVDKVVTSKVYGEMSSFNMPVGYGQEGVILKAAGAYSTATSAYYFGGTVYSALSGTDKGRVSNTSLTLASFDGKEQTVIYGSRPTALKFGAKSGEIVKLDSTFKGVFYKAISSQTYFQKPTVYAPNNLTNTTLSIGGTNFEFSEIEVDIKPTVKDIESAGTVTGYAGFEITDLDLTITTQLYPGNPNTKDLWAMMASNTPVAFSWSFGSGAGNTYTVSALVAFEQQDAPYESGIQMRKLVLKPVFNSSNNYKLAITIV